MLEGLALLMEHFPVYGLVAILLIGVFLIARYVRSVEMKDMRRRVEYLDGRVRALLYRDECYFDFILATESYYNRLELLAVEHNFPLEPRTSFLEFRRQWMLDRNLTNEWEQIWT